MSETMIERISRAAENAVLNPALGATIEIRGDASKLYRAIAVSVLTAMREPNAAILKAMRDTVPVDGHEWDYLEREVVGDMVFDAPRDHWHAMIDAALSEGG